MVLIKHIYTNQIHGGIISRLFLSTHAHALALHSAVKIFQIFLYEDLCRCLHTSVGCISLQNASRTALCYATNTIK